ERFDDRNGSIANGQLIDVNLRHGKANSPSRSPLAGRLAGMVGAVSSTLISTGFMRITCGPEFLDRNVKFPAAGDPSSRLLAPRQSRTYVIQAGNQIGDGIDDIMGAAGLQAAVSALTPHLLLIRGQGFPLCQRQADLVAGHGQSNSPH